MMTAQVGLQIFPFLKVLCLDMTDPGQPAMLRRVEMDLEEADEMVLFTPS